MDESVFPSLIIIMTKLKSVPGRKQWSLLAGLMNWKNSMMTRLPILQNVWRSSMKKNRKNRLQSTLLFMIQTDFVSVITCEKTSAMLHWAKSIMSLASIHFWSIGSAILKNSMIPILLWRCLFIPDSFFQPQRNLPMTAGNVFLKTRITHWMMFTAVFLF